MFNTIQNVQVKSTDFKGVLHPSDSLPLHIVKTD